MALVAVLWIVAALSIAVTGIVHTIRTETRAASAARRMVELQAVGEAAIALALQGMTAPQAGPRAAWRRVEVPYDGQVITVEIGTLNGLVDINRASPELLAALYAVAGGRNAQAAAALAQATIQTRLQPDASGRPLQFEATEDLMRVPGFDYDLYARLRPLVTADAQGSGRVNAQAAPQALLSVLAEGNTARAAALSNARLQGGQAMDTSTLHGEFIDNAVGSRYRLQAFVPIADGAQGVVLRVVDLNPDQRAGLPWRILNAETWMHAPPVNGV
ncbi:MAG: general secretion pathway protein GspK [Proteobacteria bacterium]|nr:general secretion pathway protein GspK [Pseudomonadota bacterium]